MRGEWGCWFAGIDLAPVALGLYRFGHLSPWVFIGLGTCRPGSL